MDFLFLRHAESLGNLGGIMQGREDYALSEAGHRQAQTVANYLRTELFVASMPTRILCSPLLRTLETARPVQEQCPDVPFQTHPDLVEVDSGIFSGLTWQEAGKRHPEVRDAFRASRDWGAVPGGESKIELWQRAEQFLQQMRTQFDANATLLIVSHGGFIRAALSVLSGVGPEEELFICIDNTSLSHAGEKNGRRYLRYINDTRHLNTCDLTLDYIPH